MERVVSELSNKFAKFENLEIHIILYGLKRNIFYTLNEKITIHKPHFKFDNKKRFRSTLKTILFLRKKIISLQPDTLLSFGEYWNNLVLISTIGLKFPVYIADRSEPMKDLGIFQNKLRKLLYPKAKGLILQTHWAKEIYQKQFVKLNIEVIGNPINEIKKRKNIVRENTVLMVGRLIESKHQDRLIRIFSKINIANWKLVLVGDDAKKQKNRIKLSKLIQDLKMKDKIILAGKQKDVKTYYLKSKIFAFTSSSEGFPNVIGEAMSAELPVISYDCKAGPSEIITNDKDGFLIPLFDDKLFQSKLELLMHDDDLRSLMGKNAMKNIKKYSKEIISEKYLNFILN